MKRTKIQKKLMLTKNLIKTEFTAFSSQPIFSLFSVKTFLKKLKLDNFKLSIFEIFKIESQKKKNTFLTTTR